MNTLHKAIARYLAVAGVGAIQPSNAMSTLTRKGTAILRNVNGTVAVVTSKGQVFDRIGGTRLDTDTTSGRA
jgi:hypothetical protein